MTRQSWDTTYSTKTDDQVSWTQTDPTTSLSLIAEVAERGRVIDVGGGTSVLSQRLMDRGYTVAVLDISSEAVNRAKVRLGPQADFIQWIVGDVTKIEAIGTFDVWHDRALFHFLTNAQDRKRYVELLWQSVPIGGYAVIAAFAPDGPAQCSGLDVERYDSRSLQIELGAGLELVKAVQESHKTPWGAPQSFQYSVFKRV
jgi:trans-aconitate methyltransferase